MINEGYVVDGFLLTEFYKYTNLRFKKANGHFNFW